MKSFEFILTNLEKVLRNYAEILLFFLGLALAVFRLSTHSYGLDEIFSIHISKNWPSMINVFWNEEANMWFYYFILHFWQTFGQNEFIIRSLSVLFSLGAIPVIFNIGKILFDKNVARISVLLMVVNIFYIISAQLARGYSLSLLLTLLSMYCFLQFNKGKKYKVFYVLSTTLSVYTHFYAGFVFLSQVLIAFFTKYLKRYYLAFLVVVIFLAPIVFSPSIRSHQVDWIEKPTLRNLIGTSYVFSGDFPPLLIIYGFIFIFVALYVVRNIRNIKYSILSIWLVAPVATSFLFSLFVKPIFQSVYFLICLPPFVILAADGISRISKRKLKVFLLMTIVAFSVVRLFLWYSKNTEYKWVFSNNDDDWRSMVNFINENSQEGDAIIFYGYYNKMPYEFYSESNKLVYARKDTPRAIEISSSAYDLGGGGKLPEPNFKLLSDLEYKRVWLLLRNADRGVLNRDQQLSEIKLLLEKKYRSEKVNEAPGLKVNLYISKNESININKY